MNPNEPDPKVGLSGSLRAIGAMAVMVLALVGILAVFEIIPREALQEWLTKFGLVLVIVVAAAIVLALLMRKT